MNAIPISKAHMAMSDCYLRDAGYGGQSPRGRVDTAFDSGYLALLSVLTDEERRSHEHPSPQVVEIASRRLALDPGRGVFLQSCRYSGDDMPALPDVLGWAEGVRARVRELGIK